MIGTSRDHSGIILILLLTLAMRAYLAPISPYWLDEYLSAIDYGLRHETVWAMAKDLGRRSVHPPLYQMILYGWMSVFGDGELATRTLSSLYVAGAALCLYLIGDRIFGRAVALAAAVIVSLIPLGVQYGLETRSYAQTMFLSSLSSLILLHILTRTGGFGWNEFRRVPVWALMVSYFALLMTHYYNIFFIAAHGAVLVAWSVWAAPRAMRPVAEAILRCTIVGAIPFLLLYLFWGDELQYMIDRRAGGYRTSAATTPWNIFSRMMLQENFAYYGGMLLACATAGLAAAAASALNKGNRDQVVSILSMLAIMILPFVVAWALFSSLSGERLNARYFIFAVPPLAFLLAVAATELVRLLGLIPKIGNWRVSPPLILVLALVIPLMASKSLRASMVSKGDNRERARLINALVSGDPDNNYIIYEVSTRKLLEYYWIRDGAPLRTRSLITFREHRSKIYPFDKDRELIERRYDYVILAFSHPIPRDFPHAVETLQARYEQTVSLMRGNRGFYVFRVNPDARPSNDAQGEAADEMTEEQAEEPEAE